MQQSIGSLKSAFERLEEIKISPLIAFSIVLAIGCARYLLECIYLPSSNPGSDLSGFVDILAFYFFVFLFFLAGQKLFLKRISYAPILLGCIFAIIPPIVDGLILDSHQTYAYLSIGQFFTGEGVPLGEMMAIYAAVGVFAEYIAISKGELFSFLPAAVYAWLALFAACSLNSEILNGWIMNDIFNFFNGENWGVDFLHGFHAMAVIRLMMAFPAIIYLDPQFLAFLRYRASRWILFMGISMFAISLFPILMLDSEIAAIIPLGFSFLILFMLNTRGDEKEDKENKRPQFSFPGLTWIYVFAFFGVSLFFAYLYGLPPLFFTAIGLQLLIAFSYSAPIKLKRFFPLAYVVEGIFFALLFIGYGLGSEPHALTLPGQFMLCLMVFVVGSAIKDCKDEDGDRIAGVHTLFTTLDARTAEKAWVMLRILLVFGPISFVFISQGGMQQLEYPVSAIFAALAAYVLFISKMDREKQVDAYIYLFSGLLIFAALI